MKYMIVNGKHIDYEPCTLLEYLQRQGYNPAHVVVEKNMEIITREYFGDILLAQGDEINILQFMGGG